MTTINREIKKLLQNAMNSFVGTFSFFFFLLAFVNRTAKFPYFKFFVLQNIQIIYRIAYWWTSVILDTVKCIFNAKRKRKKWRIYLKFIIRLVWVSSVCLVCSVLMCLFSSPLCNFFNEFIILKNYWSVYVGNFIYFFFLFILFVVSQPNINWNWNKEARR